MFLIVLEEGALFGSWQSFVSCAFCLYTNTSRRDCWPGHFFSSCDFKLHPALRIAGLSSLLKIVEKISDSCCHRSSTDNRFPLAHLHTTLHREGLKVRTRGVLGYLLLTLIRIGHSMTIRDKVEEESPDGHVLFIEDLRKCLGIGTSGCETPASDQASASVDPTKPFVEVLLVGHDLRGDFPKMRADGIDFDRHLYYFGCIDTYVVIEDTCKEHFGQSLSRLMEHYGLAQGRIVRPKNLPASKAKFIFFGAHNAGNDAIATLKVAIAQALDSEIKRFYGKSNCEDDLTDESLSKPLRSMKKNMILLAYDTEGVESNRYDRQGRRMASATTEHGFAWLILADVADVPPGRNGINWHPYIQARHWLNWDYRNFANFKYVVGNPLGFWKEYGETRYYVESEGPVPFHQLFRELANAAVVKGSSDAARNATAEGITSLEEVTSLLEKTAIGESTSILKGEMADMRGQYPTFRGNAVRGRGNIPNFRGSSARGDRNMVGNGGNSPNFRGNSARGDRNVASNGGNSPNFRGNSAGGDRHMASNRGRNPRFRDNMARDNEYTTDKRGKTPKSRGNVAPGEGQ